MRASDVDTRFRRFVRWLTHYGVGAILIPLAFFLVSLHNLYDYGETSDEAADKMTGDFYYREYPKTGLADINARLGDPQRNYGPVFDTFDVRTADVLLNKRRWVKETIAAHHVPVIVVSTLGLVTVFLLGASAYGQACGFASQLALLLMPQFVGHSQNNLKDQPVAFFFALAMLAFLLALKRGSLWRWALAGCLGGLAYAVKINGIFVLPVAALWALPFILREPRRLPVWVLRFAVATAAYVATVPLLWPYYRTHTLSRFLETIATFRKHVFNEIVFYMGQHVPARQVPWHFPFVMFAVNTPLLQLSLAVLGLALLVKLLIQRRLDEAGPLLLFAVWLFFPMVVQVASGTPRYDGVRHYLYLMPALALLAGTAAVRIWRWAEKRRLGPPALRVALFALPILFLARTLIAYHPYEVVFFNSLAGGPSHAREKFELDYWGTSLLEASRWINANLPSGSRLWFTQPGIHRVKVDENRFFFVDPDDRPNYKISLLRGMVMTYDHDDDYLHPRRRVLHEITVKGAPILQIFEMEENRDVPEGATLTPASDAPPRLKPGLLATVSVDNKPPEKMPVQERLLIDCQRSPYRNHVTEMLAWGYLRVTAAGPYLFELYSDDFATVWLGKDAVIANVSTHTTHKTVVLSPGLYPMRMKYHNAAGEACLALRWKPQGATEIAILSTPDLLHDANTPKPATP